MKIGLDIHGVIDVNTRFYSLLARIAIERGHAVHIITGSMLDDTRIEDLKSFGMSWTHLFSISDYHRHLGTHMTFTDPNNPWIDHDLWDKTKATYCEEEKISFHIDDTQRYGEYFKTPFALYDFENNRLDWHYETKKHGAFLLDTPEIALDMIEKVVQDTIDKSLPFS